MNPNKFPNQDIRVTEQFLHDHEHLLLYLTVHLIEVATETPNLVDSDLKDALESLVRTYRTLNSGLYYESRPTNVLAAAIFAKMMTAVDELRKKLAEEGNATAVRDLDLLGMFVFLQRLEIQHNNGRRLGRAFIDFLRSQFPEVNKPADASPLIV